MLKHCFGEWELQGINAKQDHKKFFACGVHMTVHVKSFMCVLNQISAQNESDAIPEDEFLLEARVDV